MLIARLQKTLSGKYIRNVGWMASAEIANRLIRLASTVILARMFSPQDYGLMAIIYTICDFFQVFTLKGGVGAKIIQADEQDVKTICNTAYWLNWITCGSLFIIQCLVAFLLPYFSQDQTLTLPLFAVAFTYLAYPLFVTHLTLIERENRFKATATCNVVIAIVSSIITATFALLGMGIWAIIWPMLLTAPIWIIITWKYHPWRPPLRFTLERWREILGFSGNLLINDLLNRVRLNIDYLIVGKYLGIETLGLYYFAFNAGSGITNSILYTFMLPLFPYICEVKNNYAQFKERYFGSLRRTSAILIPIILLQASLSPIYVPIIFGEKWIPAIPVLILVCLSNIPKIYSWASYLLLNAVDKTRISLMIDSTFTLIFIISIVLLVNKGIFWVAFVVLFSNLALAAFVPWINKFAFGKIKNLK
ncbi:lipopolysaccharide biosynthesis protein [Nostoc flagelliforme FACHB-838]|uniref:Lipopolysaccharide biosynthesis protein n=1 Tax=Nostoc flagelliforme FACHB-838 TaxID=2692904 RepID=A0ABR8DRV1_9NOSO|nr:lipopolysaccharide biosynthesis protein [Nostoc flagelliforme]MBD2531224.1 lipopolysaccharide biosynthesis protein [Nostoc flagelliforme FACHB-838]